MAQKKKKTKTPAKKKAKSPAKKKVTATARKKTKSPARKKIVHALRKKTKAPVSMKPRSRGKKIESAPKDAPVPEVIKQDEVLHPIQVHEETPAEMVAEHKQSEHQFENREEVVMNQENQRVKSAMSTRQKRVFRTQTHR